MNCTIRTCIPYPTARTAIPRHEVVLPFPSPVMTSTSPRRGFSGIRSGAFEVPSFPPFESHLIGMTTERYRFPERDNIPGSPVG